MTLFRKAVLKVENKVTIINVKFNSYVVKHFFSSILSWFSHCKLTLTGIPVTFLIIYDEKVKVLDSWQVTLMSMFSDFITVHYASASQLSLSAWNWVVFASWSSSFQSCLWLIIHFIVVAWKLSSSKLSLKKVWLKRISAQPAVANVQKRWCNFG